MTRPHASRVIRPRGDDWEEEYVEVIGHGSISTGLDLELTANELQRERRKRREALKRRRPVGFAPWPEKRP